MKYYEHISSFEAEIVKCEHKNNKTYLTFSDSIFYPGGGGQPADTGSITVNSNEYKVIEVNGLILIIDGTHSFLGKALQKIDYKRRVVLSSMHTAEHLIFKCIQMQVPDAKVIKNDFREDESKVFISAPMLNWDIISKAEIMAAQIIKENRKIIEHVCKREELSKFPNLRMSDRVTFDIVRVLEIENFDYSACKGVHLNSTSEIGGILVTHFNRDSENWVIRFILKPELTLIDYSKKYREARDILETADIVPAISKLNSQLEIEKSAFRELLLEVLKNPNKDGTLEWVFVPRVDSKLANEIFGVNVKNVGIIISNKENGFLVMIYSKTIPAKEILSKLTYKFGGKGGGSDAYASGTVTSKNYLEIVEFVKEI